MKEHPLMAIHERGELRRKLIDLDNETCDLCRNNKKRERIWLKILEQVLYKRRKNEQLAYLDYAYCLYYRDCYFNADAIMIYVLVFIAGVIVGVAIENFLKHSLDKGQKIC